MSKVDYRWHAEAPPEPDVYVTRRGGAKHQTQRYWDGSKWHEIAYGNSRGGTPFTWPKNSRVKKPTPSVWMSKKEYSFYLRLIRDPKPIEWGEAFKVYEQNETLAYLVEIGVLPPDWQSAFQDSMRACNWRRTPRPRAARSAA